MQNFNIKNITEMTKCDDGFIQCPVCGMENTHLVDANLIEGEDKYRARPQFRQDVASIKMYCENDHFFKVMIGEHKGMCYLCFEV